LADPSWHNIFASMAAGGYLSSQGAANLASYSYTGVDKSIIANLVMKHYWNWLIDNVVPLWIAPNLLTLFGWLCVVFSFLLLVVYCPEGVDGIAPNWVYGVIAALVFMYQTFDNLDGKQARRTGSSSALGEVFDHGADSMSVPMFAITYGNMLQLGPVLTFASLLIMSTVFYLAHWEGYFTRSLILRPVTNPTEAQLGMIFLLLMTAWYSPHVWLIEISLPLIGLQPLKYLVFYLSVAGGVSTFADHSTQVVRYCQTRQQPLRPAVLYMLPFSLLVVCSVVWAWYTPAVLQDHARTFVYAIGLMFSYLAIRSIVQSVAREPFKIYYNVLSPLLLIAVHAMFADAFQPLFDLELVLQAFFIYVLLLQANLVVTLVSEFSYYLDIRPFKIRPKSDSLPSTMTQVTALPSTPPEHAHTRVM